MVAASLRHLYLGASSAVQPGFPMHLSDFDFDLPEALIATRPVKPRSAARLLVADGDAIHDAHVRDLVTWLRPGDETIPLRPP